MLRKPFDVLARGLVAAGSEDGQGKGTPSELSADGVLAIQPEIRELIRVAARPSRQCPGGRLGSADLASEERLPTPPFAAEKGSQSLLESLHVLAAASAQRLDCSRSQGNPSVRMSNTDDRLICTPSLAAEHPRPASRHVP